MKSSFIGAALVGVLNAGVSFAGSPEPADGMPGLFATGSSANAEGGVGGEGVRVASALAAASRFLSDIGSPCSWRWAKVEKVVKAAGENAEYAAA